MCNNRKLIVRHAGSYLSENDSAALRELTFFTVCWSDLFFTVCLSVSASPPPPPHRPHWQTKASSIKGSFDLLSIQSFNFVLLLFRSSSNNFQRKISLTSEDCDEREFFFKKWDSKMFRQMLNLSFDQKRSLGLVFLLQRTFELIWAELYKLFSETQSAEKQDKKRVFF